MTANRSSEELAMRDLIVPRLRSLYPDARIIHELPLRYSSNRIDLAAITPSQIVSVEIKSSKDVANRLEAQLRAFLPVSARVIVALAPKWNQRLDPEIIERPGRTTYRHRHTEAQDIINRVGGHTETWTVDVGTGAIEITDRCYRDSRPWHAKMLDMLHVQELVQIASRHRCWSGKRPVHLDLVHACNELMTGREIVSAVCGALRTRDAFCIGTDPAVLGSYHFDCTFDNGYNSQSNPPFEEKAQKGNCRRGPQDISGSGFAGHKVAFHVQGAIDELSLLL